MRLKFSSLIVFIVAFIVLSLWFEFFIRSVLPMIYPTILAGRFWMSWLVMGLFIGPVMLLIIYVSIKVTGSSWQFNRTQWKIVLVGSPLALVYLSFLGFLFSTVLPAELEGIRSLTLPAIVLAITIILLSRTKYTKKYRMERV